MQEVTKEVFYSYVNPRDICVSVRSFTYDKDGSAVACTSDFKKRNGQVMGTAFNQLKSGSFTKYYLSDKAIEENKTGAGIVK